MFAAVYEEKSFTGAARREHATQSGVSQHINKLEGSIGVQLFLRGKGLGVVPTPAGEAYYARCVDVLKAHRLAAQTLDEYSTGHSGEIVVGLMPTMTRCQLPSALLQFSQQHPNVAVRILEAYSHVLTEMVRAGELDFAIVPSTAKALNGVRESHFMRTRECVVSSPVSCMVHGEPVEPARLHRIKLVVPGPSNARRGAIEKYLSVNGVEIARRLELDAMLGTLGIVMASDWMAILPRLLMASDLLKGQRRFTVNPIADPPLWLDLTLIEPAREPLSAAASAFLDMLRDSANRDNG